MTAQVFQRIARQTPWVLLGLVILTYGLLIPWLGFYWDDLPYLWLYHSQGPTGFLNYVASDRPFSAWIFFLTTTLFGEHAIFYHLLALLLRWICTLAFWWLIRLLWPEQARLATWAAMLFVVYPGFLQQPIALIYNHHLSVFGFFLLSACSMIWAIRKPEWSGRLILVGVLASLSMFSLEYFVGLELLRPVLLWIALSGSLPSPRDRWRRIIKSWLPYLPGLLIFIIWRVWIFQFPTYQPQIMQIIQEAPLRGLGALMQTILADLYKVAIVVWSRPLQFPEGALTIVAYFAILFISGFGIFNIMRLMDQVPPDTSNSQDQWAKEAFMLGGIALLLAGWPSWITNLPVGLDYPWDRLTLAFIPGASLFTTAAIEWLFRQPTQRALILAGLVSLSIGFHFQNATLYRRDSETLRTIFWQLAWRVPGLQPGTIILTQDLPLRFFSDNSLTSPLNFLYDPGNTSREISYLFYDAEARLGTGYPALVPGLLVEQRYRSFTFSGSTTNTLVVYYRSPGCLRVLHPVYDEKTSGPQYPISEAIQYSNINQIIQNPQTPAQPPEHIIGSEPEKNWCYYFQKADLARQAGNWEEIIKLWQATEQLRDVPNEASEKVIFMEAFARMKYWEQAISLSQQVSQVPYLRPLICDTWTRIDLDPSYSPEEKLLIRDVMEEASCFK
jgi:hypothetical protein